MMKPDHIQNKATTNGHVNGNGHSNNGCHQNGKPTPPAQLERNGTGEPNKQIDPTVQSITINTTPDTISGVGGDSGLLNDPRRNRTDARMMSRALRNRWGVSKDLRKRAVERVGEWIEGGDARLQRSGVRLLVDMNEQNIAVDLEQDKNDRIDEGKATENVASVVRIVVEFDQGG